MNPAENAQERTRSGIIVGIDFDNTIVGYDELLWSVARERGLISDSTGATKREIRDRIRLLPDGEIEWQKCQAVLYGSRIAEARLIEGVGAFLKICRGREIPVHIVSHKTEFSRFDSSGTNLRTAALEWMAAKRFFAPDGLRFTERDVHFAATRDGKIERIRELGCTHFIDDLEETFLEPGFPEATVRLLYEPGRMSPAPPGVALMRTWQEIHDYFFGVD